MWLVKLRAAESPEAAALLRGHTLLVPAAGRPALEDEDEFYVTDLVGLRVELAGGAPGSAPLGVVVDLLDGAGAPPPPAAAAAAAARR
jgi:16S rRNA processing protein RimM